MAWDGTFTEADVERFLDKCDKLPNGCWYWMGARSRGGQSSSSGRWYGSFHVSGFGTVRAHIFSATALGMGRRPGDHLDHECNFSMCVNPAHIVSRLPCENTHRHREEPRPEMRLNGRDDRYLFELVRLHCQRLEIDLNPTIEEKLSELLTYRHLALTQDELDSIPF